MEERLLTIPAVCERLSCGRTTAYSLISAGKLPAVKVGAATRVAESSLVGFIRGLKAESGIVEPDDAIERQRRAAAAMAAYQERSLT